MGLISRVSSRTYRKKCRFLSNPTNSKPSRYNHLPLSASLNPSTPCLSLAKSWKKIKHKRTKVKMATLKYYKVDDTGKIERKRKECPADICGPGIFMSNHKDRQYCGKCGLTIKF